MPTKRILVIDDEEAILQVIQCCLEDLGGWEVVITTSATEGLALAQSQCFDGILLDISMWEMDGYTTFEKLQENAITRKIPVVLLTARVQPEDKIGFAQLGVAGVILKPFNPLTLVEAVADSFGWE